MHTHKYTHTDIHRQKQFQMRVGHTSGLKIMWDKLANFYKYNVVMQRKSRRCQGNLVVSELFYNRRKVISLDLYQTYEQPAHIIYYAMLQTAARLSSLQHYFNRIALPVLTHMSARLQNTCMYVYRRNVKLMCVLKAILKYRISTF